MTVLRIQNVNFLVIATVPQTKAKSYTHTSLVCQGRLSGTVQVPESQDICFKCPEFQTLPKHPVHNHCSVQVLGCPEHPNVLDVIDFWTSCTQPPSVRMSRTSQVSRYLIAHLVSGVPDTPGTSRTTPLHCPGVR